MEETEVERKVIIVFSLETVLERKARRFGSILGESDKEGNGKLINESKKKSVSA